MDSRMPERLARDTTKGGLLVSTVRLYNHYGSPEWETMVFPGENDYHDLFCARYDTEEDARKGHDIVVSLLNSRAVRW